MDFEKGFICSHDCYMTNFKQINIYNASFFEKLMCRKTYKRLKSVNVFQIVYLKRLRVNILYSEKF